MKQYISRRVEIDLGHRVMDERFKCYSIHGHRASVHMTFEFSNQSEIGYCIDFKEIKRVGAQWIDDKFDHGFAANPKDKFVIEACQKTNSKYYLMSLNGKDNYCNPTAENISREIFLALEILFEDYPGLKIHRLRFYETPNCWIDTEVSSILPAERENFLSVRGEEVRQYAKEKGRLEYDIRKVK
ncbi:6-carboxytetrahydropterin synthase [Coxiella burnetii]|uniref:6-carboxy-5,6,7,8-tetrahydropterin synthase n=2 Tax=Coxiella burnetii TaxID=777 RepID=Q83AK2_COXBU|nr:6-carboxytetrahydropterin synthase [Coxiella burnetii]NP_820860.1 queuosine biosynthesis protein [Coxiella burnetii RSA 493]AAO91374.1 queuosine biosynthesis protein [Coxiella burnetii RSA 493]ABS77195.1 queuosine biosynthesis protein [Coxiella burnetii Dugway 5J108-111]ABX78019.1 conserved hypothetical protein [Coxiella burnetii RSA 331]ACJ19500.1 queuosine biosynthesis protein [Coxiella burnetii CbuK_Q154]AML48224.1 queuosine biosynthesis protein [Coxiella burnetii]